MKVNFTQFFKQTDEELAFYFGSSGTNEYGVQDGFSDTPIKLKATVVESKPKALAYDTGKSHTFVTSKYSIYIANEIAKDYDFDGCKVDWRGLTLKCNNNRHSNRNYTSHRIVEAVVEE